MRLILSLDQLIGVACACRHGSLPAPRRLLQQLFNETSYQQSDCGIQPLARLLPPESSFNSGLDARGAETRLLPLSQDATRPPHSSFSVARHRATSTYLSFGARWTCHHGPGVLPDGSPARGGRHRRS